MATGYKSGGRVKGSLNKKSLEVKELCEKLNCSPMTVLIHICNKDAKALGYDNNIILKLGKNGEVFEEERITIKDRLSAAQFICDKLYPDVKSIELTGNSDADPIEVHHNADLKELIKIARGK